MRDARGKKDGHRKPPKTEEVEQKLTSRYIVYILRTSANTLYIGQTNNLEKRLKQHQSKSGRSAKYLKYFPSFKLVYKEEFSTRSEAMKREWELKQWPRAKKEAIIAGNLDL